MLTVVAICWMVATVPEFSAGDERRNMRSDEEVWKRVERNDDVIVYVPLDGSGRSTRIEYVLRGGETLVDDPHDGLSARVEMRESVDWITFTGTGAELTEDNVQSRAAAGDCFVVLRYQDSIDGEGNVTRSVLRSVEEYSGRTLIRQEEPGLEVAPPQHLTGTYILVPEGSDD